MTLDYSNVKDYNDWPVNLPILRIEDMMLLNGYLYAIPSNQMSITPGLYQQNTGY